MVYGNRAMEPSNTLYLNETFPWNRKEVNLGNYPEERRKESNPVRDLTLGLNKEVIVIYKATTGRVRRAITLKDNYAQGAASQQHKETRAG
jgi:hypothetical protein